MIAISLGSLDPLYSDYGRAKYNFIIFNLLLTVLFCIYSTNCFGQYDNIPSNRSGSAVANSELNEFDLGGLCNGAGADGAGNRLGRFGLMSDNKGSLSPYSNFAFVTSSFTADTGIYGDFSICSRHMYYYRLDKDRNFVMKRIDESDFHELSRSLIEYRHKNIKYFSEALDSADDPEAFDSIGGCMLPLHWRKLDGIRYTLIITSSVGIVDDIPFTPVDAGGAQIRPCSYWGNRRLSNSSIISASISSFSFDIKTMFVFDESYLQGFIFDKDGGLQCRKGSGAVLDYILVRKDYFDKNMRSNLERVLKGNAQKEGTNSFSSSINISESLSKWTDNFVADRGCNK